jgi:SAM-dependent methyltransferase
MNAHYDTVWSKAQPDAHFKAKFPETALKLFRERGVKRVLDLGSGDGANAVFLALQGFDVHGIEISLVGVQKTRELAQKMGVAVSVQQGDMYMRLPYADGSFDAVFSYQSLNHNTLPNIIALFREINRVLKQGGIFSVKTADRKTYKLKKLRDNVYLDEEFNEEFEFLDEQTYVPLTGHEQGLTHYAFYKDQLEKEVCIRGFRLLQAGKTQWHILADFEKARDEPNHGA